MKIELRSPATGASIGFVESQEKGEVAKAIAKARGAQAIWAKLSFKERATHIKKIQAFLRDNTERACHIISQATGKLHQDALATEVMPCILTCSWYMSNTANVLKPEKLPTGSICFGNKSSTLTYEPVGVVGIISPWNYPFTIPFGEVIMGLMAGNAVVLKVAANVALVGAFIAECMEAGDLPNGLFHHLIVSGPEIAPAMFAGGIDKLFFTGSVRVGKQLMAEAAPTLTPICLELGGNDPMIVLDDAPIERAVNCACWAGFQNAGQSCGGVERVYVHRSVYQEFLEQLIAKTQSLRHGCERGEFDVDMGSVTTKSQYEVIQSHVNEAVAQGAQIVAQSLPVGDCSKGYFFPATVLINCTHEMRIMKEETFGPVLPVVPFDDEEEALRLANDSDLALTSSVFSSNKKHAQRIAARLQSGVVTINDHLYTHGVTETPWGGWKGSGLGRTHGYLGLKEMCNVKCINEDCISGNLLKRNLWWFPFNRDTFSVLLAAVRFSSPRSVGEWLGAVKVLLCKTSYMFKPWKVKSRSS